MNNVIHNDFDMYVLPHIVKALQQRGVLNIVRIYTDEVEAGMKKSRFGYEGDTWYIREAGRYYDAEEKIFIFQDNGARKRSGQKGIDIIPPCEYQDAKGEKIMASKMPKWAARTRGEIHGVSFPKRIQEIPEGEILSFGFERGGETDGMVEYSLGDYNYCSNMGLKHIFKTWWNEYMGAWRLIRKQGQPFEYIAYPYDGNDRLPEMDFLSLPQKICGNPNVIIYTIKLMQ